MRVFDPKDLKKIYIPQTNSSGEDNGQVTIIGGSSLFKGAPLFSIKAASRRVDMVFFTSPEQTLESVSSYMHAEVPDFIWVPFSDTNKYIEKSDAVLIGPGFMRFKSENSPHNTRAHVCDDACQFTRNVTKELLNAYPSKKWVIDAGSLQTIDPEWIPENAIVTPNRNEFELLFKEYIAEEESSEQKGEKAQKMAAKYKCIIVLKGAETVVASADQVTVVKGGNPGLTKGGTGDVQAGLTVALLAKNEPFLAACAASYLVKNAADKIHKRVGTFYNASDVAEELGRLL